MGRLRGRRATVVQIYCIRMYVRTYSLRIHRHVFCVCVRECACIAICSKCLLHIHYVYPHPHARLHVWGYALVLVCVRHVTSHRKCTYLYTPAAAERERDVESHTRHTCMHVRVYACMLYVFIHVLSACQVLHSYGRTYHKKADAIKSFQQVGHSIRTLFVKVLFLQTGFNLTQCTHAHCVFVWVCAVCAYVHTAA